MSDIKVMYDVKTRPAKNIIDSLKNQVILERFVMLMKDRPSSRTITLKCTFKIYKTLLQGSFKNVSESPGFKYL